jgi:hypothetical protein
MWEEEKPKYVSTWNDVQYIANHGFPANQTIRETGKLLAELASFMAKELIKLRDKQ